MSHEPLQRVKHYIAEKEFGKARAVLTMIDHPKRDEWLERVDSLERQHDVESIPKPMNPGCLGWMTAFLTPIIPTLILAFNWRRFDKKSWMWWTLLAFVLLVPVSMAALIAVMIAVYVLEFNVKVGTMAVFFTLLTAFMLFVFYPFLIAGRQDKAYKLMQAKNIYAAYDHHYDWGRGLLIWLISAAIFGAGLTWLFFQTPEYYHDGVINLTYSYEWSTNDEDDTYNCEDVNAHCRVMLSSIWSNIYISFNDGGWIDDYETNQAMADAMWDWADDHEDMIPVRRDTLEIRGHKVFLVEYTYNGWYVAELFLQRGNDNLFILIEAESERLLENNWADILELLNDMEWTPAR